jgi:hypothetical protein
MFDILLSHWAIYLYVTYVVILFALLLVYRQTPVRIYRKVRWIPGHMGRMAAQMRLRPRPLR